MSNLSQDSLAILMLCTDLGLGPGTEGNNKPYTLAKWNELSEKIRNSSLKTPSALLGVEPQTIQRELNLNDEETKKISFLISRGVTLAIQLESLTSSGIKVTTRVETNYPERFRKILKEYSPPVLYYCGDLSISNRKAIAIVGSRSADKVGQEFANYLATACVKEGYAVVSGGAKGIDSIAEEAALLGNGYVISIMASGLKSRIKEKSVREAIVRKRLLILSSVTPSGLSHYKTTAKTAKLMFIANAMERNKFVYALSLYAVAVSSDNGVGGTWAGATENLKKGWVPLFARIGNSSPEGNQILVDKMGALPLIQKQFYESNRPIEECLVNRLVDESLRQGEDLFATQPFTTSTKSLDVFEAIYPVLIKALEDSTDLDEISLRLKINKTMLKNWVKRIDNQNIRLIVGKKKKLYSQPEINFESESLTKPNYVKEDTQEYFKDLYSLILPCLIEALKTPMNQEELRKLLYVNKPQLSEWINRALDEKVIKKLNNPVRYVYTSKQSST